MLFPCSFPVEIDNVLSNGILEKAVPVSLLVRHHFEAWLLDGPFDTNNGEVVKSGEAPLALRLSGTPKLSMLSKYYRV